MKKLIFTVLLIMALTTTVLSDTVPTAYAGDIAEGNIVALINLGAMTKAQIYNPTGGSFEATIQIEDHDGTPREVMVKWIVIESVVEFEPVEKE